MTAPAQAQGGAQAGSEARCMSCTWAVLPTLTVPWLTVRARARRHATAKGHRVLVFAARAYSYGPPATRRAGHV